MIRNRCIILIMISISANLSAGQPLPEEPEEPVKDQDDKSLFNLPFLQFKNGGVRVNFAGYHAEAGLGGLLGGSGTRGGLYAGVGTPFGPHASADIGGALGGDKGAGGLRARAGLGNGLPEAAAGLGGNLDGSNGGGNGGRLYAGASNGIKTRIVTKDIGVPDIDQSNIQVIPKKSDVSQAPADSKPELIRREAAAQDDSANAVEPIPIAGLDAGIVERSAGPEVPAGAGASGGVATDATGYKGVAVSPGAAPGGPSPPPHAARRTVFDDIFNIPIATLTAVNQLLNSKLG
ncbi:uncharacterized protein LOC107047866 isoform X2 [Diachasma alloeum]|uniref:uncharacterized protein LOC107047866 isoform X2 n=1 Tax=Diachasma alloeum TaxID=454923 RepID=UPI00073823DB|nr:uncharacterized protein LOC107047866 isoform X2 [Diachasma alloeum]